MPDPAANLPGLLVVISGPSGVGKTTITHELVERVNAVFSVSATTRPQTSADVPGRDYHFIDEDQFRAMIEAGGFLEYARVFDCYYGTPRQPVVEALAQGRVVVLEIDVQGALQVRQSMPGAFMVFILPPSEDVLLERLRARRREDEAKIQRRFREAKREIETARESGAYDLFVVNDNLNSAIETVVGAIRQRVAAG